MGNSSGLGEQEDEQQGMWKILEGGGAVYDLALVI